MIDFIKEQILTNPIFSTAFFLTASGAILFQLKSVPKMVWNKIRQKLVYTVVIYQYDPLYYIFEHWLYKHAEGKYRTIEAGINKGKHDEYPPVSSDSGTTKIFYRQESGFFIIKFEGKWLLIRKNSEKMDKAESAKEYYFKTYNIQGIGTKSAIDKILKSALQYDVDSQNDQEVKLFANTQFGDWNRIGKLTPKSIEDVVLNPDLKSDILNDVKSFEKQHDWYCQRGIPYKRGYLFHGPPGNGKTSLSLALASYLNRPIYFLNLNEIERDAHLKTAISLLPKNALVLIEDIDRIYSGRDSVRPDFKISFSTLLNCLDGVFFQEGLIVIITTNHIEKLDSALIRPGRIDKIIEIKNPAKPEIETYLSKFYEETVDINGYQGHLSMSQIQGICIKNLGDTAAAKMEIQCLAKR